jgi:hypothetical protein
MRIVSTGARRPGLEEPGSASRRQPPKRNITATPRCVGSAIAACVVAGTALIVLLYATSIHSAAGRSDKATTILAGQSIGAGNLLLHGWTLPPGNYWTSDAMFYALFVRIFGLRPGLLFAEPAVVAALTVAVGVGIACERRRGTAAVLGSFTVVLLLVFATPAMALWFVGNGFHIATVLYALLAFLLLRGETFGWRWAAASLLLAFGFIGDLELVGFAAAPLLIGGLFAILRDRRWRSGVAQVSAAVVGTVAGEVVLRLATTVGSFKPTAPLPRANSAQMLTNLGHVFTYGAGLLGITNGRFGTAGVPIALLAVHAAGGLLTVACLVAAGVRLVVEIARGNRRGDAAIARADLWRLDDLLLVATVGSAAPFVLLAGPNGLGIHFLAPAVVFASVLTGRTVARFWPALPAGLLRRGVAALGVAVSLAYVAGLSYELSLPTPVQPQSPLVSWLQAHDLRNGLASYWTAAITTVESGGSVIVRPIGVNIHGHVRRMLSQSADDWYAGQHFQFYVGDSPPATLDFETAEWTWGRPLHVYRVGSYWVLVWNHSLSVAASPRP